MNILTHMFALCLRVDEWATDTTVLARDLSMPVTKVNQLFKSLGTFVAQSSTFCGGNLLSPTFRMQGREAHEERARQEAVARE